jgi:RND family efflux transporter MFP subunit
MQYPIMSHPMTRHPWLISLLCAAILIVTACSDPDDEEKPTSESNQAIVVDTITLQYQDWQGSIKTFGAVEAAEEIQLSLDFSATVSAVLVDEGESVTIGQLLIEMDQEKPRLRLQQASESALRAKAAMDGAFLNLQRRKKLAEQETVAKEILDNAELAVQRAQADYRQALATRQLAEKEQSESRITSPVDGVVDVRGVETGQSVLAGSTLMKIQATKALQIQTWVSEKDINLVSMGAKATITLTSQPDLQLKGQVKSVGINAHSATGNFPVEVIIDEQASQARPGMTAQVTIEGISIKQVLLLPESVLVDRNRRRVVYVLHDGLAVEVEPLLSAGLSDRLIVLSGLNEGDQLINSKLEQIIDGSQAITNGDTPK